MMTRTTTTPHTNILGISCFYHDSAACIVQDGRILAAAQEERFSRKKHDASFPVNAINYCLSQVNHVDYVGFYEKPSLKFNRILRTNPSIKAIYTWLSGKRNIQKHFQRKVITCTHHQSHAASAYYPSPFSDATIITVDGVGEWDTTSIGHGKDCHFNLTPCMKFPHSLGLLYATFTSYCGFKVNSGEYKLMGLAPYGNPIYRDKIYEILELDKIGLFKLKMRYFNFSKRMYSKAFCKHFGQPPRKPESEITQFYKDVSASIQVVTEECMVRFALLAHQLYPNDNLVMSGGVALNCVANSKLLANSPFRNLWIQPAAGDAGGALGVALHIWHNVLGQSVRYSQGDSCFGPEYNNSDIESFGGTKLSEDKLLDVTCDAIEDGKIVGWFQGRMEYGPRALGNRSILADPRRPEMKDLLNAKVKRRESFRPFAPAVMIEHVDDYFDLGKADKSPYMLLVAKSKQNLPAITHVDGTSRIQTVSEGRFYRLLKRFYERTGCPMLVNTSFNVRGEPIVCSPYDAYRCFENAGLDMLVMNDFVITENSLEASARNTGDQPKPSE